MSKVIEDGVVPAEATPAFAIRKTTSEADEECRKATEDALAQLALLLETNPDLAKRVVGGSKKKKKNLFIRMKHKIQKMSRRRKEKKEKKRIDAILREMENLQTLLDRKKAILKEIKNEDLDRKVGTLGKEHLVVKPTTAAPPPPPPPPPPPARGMIGGLPSSTSTSSLASSSTPSTPAAVMSIADAIRERSLAYNRRIEATGAMASPRGMKFDISRDLPRNPVTLLRRTAVDRSPGGTPTKRRTRSEVDFIATALRRKFRKFLDDSDDRR
eukprot:TRINITY_DN399_c0_g1_i4.p1 TRINITY_DN399_c0_g1~~TRINITY_DN399_c0_g1_i4.p1  ORF type:complete len:271 (+),score=98.44 TRINITY_DN399_c0_g1_i4:125-937(+)